MSPIVKSYSQNDSQNKPISQTSETKPKKTSTKDARFFERLMQHDSHRKVGGRIRQQRWRD